MGKFIDLTGKTFGRLTVKRKDANNGDGRVLWLCACSCGSTKSVSGQQLRAGKTKSCGCYARESAASRLKTHGMIKTSEYRSWAHAKERCYQIGARNYNRYGGRGIRVCDRWRNSFENFYSDMGPKPTIKHTLDRIDNDRGYSPSNCRWATHKEQNNNKRTNRNITHGGETKTLTQWASSVGINRETLTSRLTAGWPVQDALTTPVDKKFSRKTRK